MSTSLIGIEICEAELEFAVVSQLMRDLPGHPKAAMRWLELRWPEHYNRSRGRRRRQV
jgi:hypothetical protein